MSKLKRLIAISLVATMTFSLVGCGNNKSKVYKVGICQLVEHEALDQATKGFKEALTKKLGKDKIELSSISDLIDKAAKKNNSINKENKAIDFER